jgi:hypothetical protein
LHPAGGDHFNGSLEQPADSVQLGQPGGQSVEVPETAPLGSTFGTLRVEHPVEREYIGEHDYLFFTERRPTHSHPAWPTRQGRSAKTPTRHPVVITALVTMKALSVAQLSPANMRSGVCTATRAPEVCRTATPSTQSKYRERAFR